MGRRWQLSALATSWEDVIVMRRRPSARMASVGVARVGLAVQRDLGWLFREQPTEDYGIDAQVEVVDGETVRGKLLAIQIKSGKSLFREPGPGGWWFRPDAKHVRYWMNHSLPVAVILYHPETDTCYWQLVNANTLVMTPKGGWKLLIPEAQVLDTSAHVPLLEAAEGNPVLIRIRDSTDHPGQAGPELRIRESGPLPSTELRQAPIARFDVTPSRLLLMALTEIVIAPWTCIAELIESAYSSMRDTDSESSDLSISVTIPSSTGESDDKLVIRDYGIGMDSESLLTATRVGAFIGGQSDAIIGSASGSSFGLLLMALRLGRRVTIRTGRISDTSWIEMNCDLLAEEDAFTARTCRVLKEEPADHGTEITISSLRNNVQASLARQNRRIREQLGDCYSYLLREGEITIILNNQPVQPRRPCIWAASRLVMVRGARVPAVQEINQALPPGWICRRCGLRHHLAMDMCDECQSRDVIELSRQIWGWLGVQRYLHHSDFGIDFLRHGRKILYRDKSLFTWTEPGGSSPMIEYPLEIPSSAGRIVGEIHCDHVPVNFSKDSFHYDSADWKEVVHAIRGTGPLSPVRCRRLGYPPNESPLGLLFTAFRRNDPGTRYLTPGDGNHAVHEMARNWAARFHDGDPAFQTDRMWYAAALAHDKISASR
jgi:Domain of unknown function (DUF4365)